LIYELAGSGMYGTVKEIEYLKLYEFYNALDFWRQINSEKE
jgi:hypothetical protein